MWLLAGLLLPCVAGCLNLQSAFRCHSNGACVSGGQAGTCEATGYCSFPDASCAGTPRRYGSAAPSGLALVCVTLASMGDGGTPADLGDGAVSRGGDMAPDLMQLGTNLIANGTFEAGTAGWGASTGRLTRVTPGHTGQWAVEVCDTAGMNMTYTLDESPEPVLDPDPGQVYLAQAWVHAAPGAADTQTVTATMSGKISAQISISDNGTPVTLAPSDGSWHPIEVQRTVSERDLSLDAFFSALGNTQGDCFLIDDITLVRLQ